MLNIILIFIILIFYCDYVVWIVSCVIVVDVILVKSVFFCFSIVIKILMIFIISVVIVVVVDWYLFFYFYRSLIFDRFIHLFVTNNWYKWFNVLRINSNKHSSLITFCYIFDHFFIFHKSLIILSIIYYLLEFIYINKLTFSFIIMFC